MDNRLCKFQAKSREEVSNLSNLRHSRGPNCECVSVCVCLFIHMFLQVILTVCVNESLCVVASWVVFVCVCHGKRKRKRVNVVCCVCVRRPVFVGLMEVSKPPMAKSDTAVAK